MIHTFYDKHKCTNIIPTKIFRLHLNVFLYIHYTLIRLAVFALFVQKSFPRVISCKIKEEYMFEITLWVLQFFSSLYY